MNKDDFRDWTGTLRLVDGREVTAVALRSDTLVAMIGGGNQEAMQFDRKTGCAPTGEQIDPAEMYRVWPETYRRRQRAHAAFAGYANGNGVFQDLPVAAKQRWMAAADEVYMELARDGSIPDPFRAPRIIRDIPRDPHPMTGEVANTEPFAKGGIVPDPSRDTSK